MITTRQVGAVLMLGLTFGAGAALAEGDPAPTLERERAMQRYKGCHFTDEMGQHLYACVKKNDGFGTHWCYDETLETFCPAQLAARKSEEPPAEQKPAN
jgi:hypothetical protein